MRMYAVWGAALAALLAIGPVSAVRGYEGGVSVDCGTASLRVLLALEGRRVSLEEIARHLPPRRPDGHSMREIREAADALGVGLEGVSYRGRSIPAGPCIAFMRQAEHGHFLVVRRVGQTGRLVQVIDAGDRVEVVEEAELIARPEWTGLMLGPRRSRAAMVGGGAAALLGVLVLARAIVKAAGRGQPAPSGSALG